MNRAPRFKKRATRSTAKRRRAARPCHEDTSQSVFFGEERILPIFNVLVTGLATAIAARHLSGVVDVKSAADPDDFEEFSVEGLLLNSLLIFALVFVVLALVYLRDTPYTGALFFTCLVYFFTLYLRKNTYREKNMDAVYAKTLAPMFVDAGLLLVFVVRIFTEKALPYGLLAAGVFCALLHNIILLGVRVTRENSACAGKRGTFLKGPCP